MKQLLYIMLLIFFTRTVYGQSMNSADQPTDKNKRPKVGLVLSGGGAKGLAHIGALKVIEEAGLPIDFIGGTSMGSIIGAMYAVGLSADSIKKVVTALNWTDLLTDKIDRKYLVLDEKGSYDQLFAPFPLDSTGIQLPTGMINGINIDLLFNRFTFKAHEIIDFNDLPIPFICIASDLEAGTFVVLNKGSLPRAIRASMAIPTAFTPVEIDGHLLFDGGVFNNFPVIEVKQMGADIIIGIDVGLEPYTNKQLTSLNKVLEQTFLIQGMQENRYRKSLCNIIIEPPVNQFGILSFEKVDSLIKLGEYEARKHFNELRQLADSINQLSPPEKELKVLPDIKETFVSEVEIRGLEKVSSRSVLGRLTYSPPAWVSINDFEESIRILYGTRFFQHIYYTFEPTEGGNKVVYHVTESFPNTLSAGLNYNSHYNASILVNAIFRNLWKHSSKLSIYALLSDNPYIDLLYIKHNNDAWFFKQSMRWRWDLGTSLSVNNYQIYDYYNGNRIASYEITDFSLKLFTQTIFFNSYALGLGLEGENASKNNSINPFNIPTDNDKLLNAFVYLKLDRYNSSYLPERGMFLSTELKYLPNILESSLPQASQLNFEQSMAHPLNKSFSFIHTISLGITFADTLPNNYYYRTGGWSANNTKNSMQLIGYKMLENPSLNAMVIRLDLQYKFRKKNYLILRGNLSRVTDEPDKLIIPTQILYGAGITYAYLTLAGPIEVTLMTSPRHLFLFHFNFGFRI